MIHLQTFHNLTVPNLEIPDLSLMHALAEQKNSTFGTGLRWNNPLEADAARWALFMIFEAGLGHCSSFNYDFYNIRNCPGFMTLKLDKADYNEGPERRLQMRYQQWQETIGHTVDTMDIPEYPLPAALKARWIETWFNKDISPDMLENRNTDKRIVVEVDRQSPMFKMLLMCSRTISWQEATNVLNEDVGAVANPNKYVPPVDQFCLTYSPMKRTWCKGRKTSYYGKEYQIVKLSDLIDIRSMPEIPERNDFLDVPRQDLAKLVAENGVHENQRYIGELGLRPGQNETVIFTLKEISNGNALVCIEDEDESVVPYSDLAKFKINKEIHAGFRYPVNQHRMPNEDIPQF